MAGEEEKNVSLMHLINGAYALACLGRGGEFERLMHLYLCVARPALSPPTWLSKAFAAAQKGTWVGTRGPAFEWSLQRGVTRAGRKVILQLPANTNTNEKKTNINTNRRPGLEEREREREWDYFATVCKSYMWISRKQFGQFWHIQNEYEFKFKYKYKYK